MTRMGRARVLTVAIAGVGLVAALVLVQLQSRAPDLLPPCFFHELTGLHCTGCGSTRALCALLRGDLPSAWAQNPLLLLVLPWIALGLLERAAAAFFPHRALPKWNVPAKLDWVFVAVVLAFSVARNLPFGRFLGPLP